MPPVSEAQRRAMYAAAAGRSTIGIPQSVGQEYVAKDRPGNLPEHIRTAIRKRIARSKMK